MAVNAFQAAQILRIRRALAAGRRLEAWERLVRLRSGWEAARRRRARERATEVARAWSTPVLGPEGCRCGWPVPEPVSRGHPHHRVLHAVWRWWLRRRRAGYAAEGWLREGRRWLNQRYAQARFQLERRRIHVWRVERARELGSRTYARYVERFGSHEAVIRLGFTARGRKRFRDALRREGLRLGRPWRHPYLGYLANRSAEQHGLTPIWPDTWQPLAAWVRDHPAEAARLGEGLAGLHESPRVPAEAER